MIETASGFTKARLTIESYLVIKLNVEGTTWGAKNDMIHDRAKDPRAKLSLVSTMELAKITKSYEKLMKRLMYVMPFGDWNVYLMDGHKASCYLGDVISESFVTSYSYPLGVFSDKKRQTLVGSFEISMYIDTEHPDMFSFNVVGIRYDPKNGRPLTDKLRMFPGMSGPAVNISRAKDTDYIEPILAWLEDTKIVPGWK